MSLRHDWTLAACNVVIPAKEEAIVTIPEQQKDMSKEVSSFIQTRQAAEQITNLVSADMSQFRNKAAPEVAGDLFFSYSFPIVATLPFSFLDIARMSSIEGDSIASLVSLLGDMSQVYSRMRKEDFASY